MISRSAAAARCYASCRRTRDCKSIGSYCRPIQIRAEEARRSAQSYLQKATEHQFEIKSFRDSFFPYNGGEIKDYFHSLGQRFSPDLMFTHRRDDLHQDHRLVADLTWNTFRNHLILEYEIPKYDGDLGPPQRVCHARRADLRTKSRWIAPVFSLSTRKAVVHARHIP